MKKTRKAGKAVAVATAPRTVARVAPAPTVPRATPSALQVSGSCTVSGGATLGGMR